MHCELNLSRSISQQMAYTTLQNAHGLRAMLLHSRMELPELYFFIIYV